MSISRDDCVARDRDDPLASFRDEFALPSGVIYLDGNSLGALPKTAEARVHDAIKKDWGEGLIRSWNNAGWIDLPTKLGGKIAPLIGAGADEVIVADSTSVNLFKLLVAALRLRPDRRTILMEARDFPTDLYIAQGVAELMGDDFTCRIVPTNEIRNALDDTVAVLALTHVNFKTGAMHDMADLTQQAHAVGALTIWDLCHTAGAVPIDLGGEPLTGWMGHAQPFSFVDNYEPAGNIKRFLSGTPNVLSMVALDASLDIWSRVDLDRLRTKSIELGDLFIAMVEARCAGHGFTLASPRDGQSRGSQVSFMHEEGYAIMQALIARGVIGDFRAPDIVRFGFTPLYTRYVDVWQAAEILYDIMETRAWDTPAFRTRAAVT